MKRFIIGENYIITVRCTFINNAAIAATNVIAALLLYLECSGRAAKYL